MNTLQKPHIPDEIKSQYQAFSEQLGQQSVVEMENTDTVRSPSGKLPTYKQVIAINGLVYRVKFVNHKTGEVTLKLIGTLGVTIPVAAETDKTAEPSTIPAPVYAIEA